MLSYIGALLPHCVGRHHNIYPQYTEHHIPVYINNMVEHIGIIEYFALREEMNLARYLLTQTLDNIEHINIRLLTADQINELFSNFDYTRDQARSIMFMLEQVIHEKLNPLVSYLASITQTCNIVGYTHITKYAPDRALHEYYDLTLLGNNYLEAEYILSLIELEKRNYYCERVIIYGNIDFNKVDTRYLKLLVDNCSIEHRYYYLAYALVYDKFAGKFDGSLITLFLDNVYNKNIMMRPHGSMQDIIYLERLLTTAHRKHVLYNIILSGFCDLHIPKRLPPRVHKQVAKVCVSQRRRTKIIIDDCKYCRYIKQIDITK